MDILKKFFKKNKNKHLISTKENTSIRSSAEIVNMSQKPENISIGNNTVIKGKLLIFPHAGKIQIGDDCILNHNSEIWSGEDVKIGNRVLIAHNVNIIDTNAHPTDYNLRHTHYKNIIEDGFSHDKENEVNKNIKSKKIIIEDDVWIGIGAFIGKGVKVGSKSIISPMSYVINDIPDNSIVSGNPAKVIRTID